MTQIQKLSRAFSNYAPPLPVEFREEELDAMSIVRLVRRQIGLIALVTVIGMAAAIAAILNIERVYYAESRLLIQSPLTTTLTSTEAEQYGHLNLTTEVERLLARTTAVRVIQEFALDQREEFNPTPKVTLLDPVRAVARRLVMGSTNASSAPIATMDRVIPEYFRALLVTRNGASDVVHIGFSSTDPELAAAVPNALLRIYLDEREKNRQERVRAADEWLSGRIAEQRVRVDKDNLSLNVFRKEVGLVSADARADNIEVISSLNQQRADIASKRADLKIELSALNEAPTSTDQVQDSEVVAPIERELQLQQQLLNRLLKIYGSNHAEVVDTRAKIQSLSAAIDAEIDRNIQTIRTKLAALDRDEEAVLTRLTAAQNALSLQASAETPLTNLMHAAERSQAALDDLEAQRLALAAQSEIPVAEAEVLSPATVPLGSQGRSRLIYLLGALLAAGSLGVTAGYVREMLDTTIRSPQQLDGGRSVAAAAMVPALSRRDAQDVSHLLQGDRGEMFADAIRGALLSLEHSNGGGVPATLLVTSALPSEGKSLIAGALALELVATGRKVLLVDWNLRQGSTHSPFGYGPEPGLTDFVWGESDLADFIHHDNESGVDYISRGNQHFVQFPQRDLVSQIIQSARENGQVVIFDSAPVLTSADTALLAALTERTLLTVRWGGTRRRAVELATHRLQSGANANLMVVINMVNPRKHALYGFKDAELFTTKLRRYFQDNT